MYYYMCAGPSARCDHPVPEAQTAEPVGPGGEGLRAGEHRSEAGARGTKGAQQGINGINPTR